MLRTTASNSSSISAIVDAERVGTRPDLPPAADWRKPAASDRLIAKYTLCVEFATLDQGEKHRRLTIDRECAHCSELSGEIVQDFPIR
jgi:hypothetical protein